MIAFRWFMWCLMWRFRIMYFRDPDLRNLLKDKQLIIKIQIKDCCRFLGFDDGNIMLIKDFSATPTLEIQCTSVQLIHHVVKSAAIGDHFWLAALRDRRIQVKGDMGLLLWFFGLCRHLKFRRKVGKSNLQQP